MFQSQMSKLFWEIVIVICALFEYKLQLRPPLLQQSA